MRHYLKIWLPIPHPESTLKAVYTTHPHDEHREVGMWKTDLICFCSGHCVVLPRWYHLAGKTDAPPAGYVRKSSLGGGCESCGITCGIIQIVVHNINIILLYCMYIYIYAMRPPLSMPLAPNNCRQIHQWRVQGFPRKAHTNGGNYDGV